MKKTPLLLVIFLVLLITLSCAACTSQSTGNSGSAEGDSIVYTSVYPVYYLTDRIAANGIDVELIMPPSADPHNWEPNPKQMAKLESCTLFIYNGAGLEPWASKVGDLAKNSNIAVLELAQGLEGKLLAHQHHHSSGYDPHFWQDPVLAKDMAASIRDAIVKIDPDNASLYQQNYTLLAGDLDKLHHEYETTLAHCKKKEIVVTHQAFGYLAKRYNLEQIPIMGVSAESEPTPARLAELSQLLKDLNIGYVFTEPFTGPQIAQVLASETGVEILELNPIGGLTQEEMDSGADYLSLMRDNLEQLKVALEYEQKSDN